MFSAIVVCCLSFTAAAPGASPSAVESVARQALEKLPGKTGFAFAELTRQGSRPLFGINADERFAIGSSFKLYIFGTLVDQVNAGRRRLDDTMLLRRGLVGPPHSEMADWPTGSPVTLYTLALKMISVSDNTATDHLHFLLGREQIEAQMLAMGHSDPTVNRPLLSTREMAMLRDRKSGMPAKDYQKLDQPSRRKFLVDHVTGVPNYEQLDFDAAAYDLAEWYATPLDMARAMDWIYRQTMSDKTAHSMRAILAVDPKLPARPAVWTFVGFKGGSEPQLLAGNWLLEHRLGKWYTFHVFCNSPSEPVAPDRMLQTIEKILAAIEPTLNQEH